MDLGTAMASAWSSGISVYGVAAVLGIAGRQGWTDSADFLQHGWVIAAALALWLFELVVDKIPVVDSVWDGVHTLIRPLGGALVLSGVDDSSANELVLATSGGLLALSAHAAKASVRALVNLSPEPFSNSVASVTEDGLVAAVLAIAFANPAVALVITIFLVLASIAVTVVAFRVVRRALRKLSPPRPIPPPPT
jgi:hypothetical protein